MNNILLIIENNEIELDEQVIFAITRQFEEISNPTIICNDYSKSVKIPFTAKNNEIFGHIYNPDRVIVMGDENTAPIGLYFDPYKKLNFILRWNNSVLMTGYAKMIDIVRENGSGYYDITLNGQLGKLFQEMKKIQMVKTDDIEEKYYLDTSAYLEDYINKDLVYKCWNNDGENRNMGLEEQYLYVVDPRTGKKSKIRNINWNITDYIGFTPNNAIDLTFDYTTYQKDVKTSNKFVDALAENNEQFYKDTGLKPDTVIKNGLLPREIGEFRSYLQLPFIYFDKLFKIFQKKAEALTGYLFKLDESWFNNDNPYWSKLVFMLNRFNIKDGNTFFNQYTYTYNGTGELNWNSYGQVLSSKWQERQYFDISVDQSKSKEAYNRIDYTTGNITILPNDYFHLKSIDQKVIVLGQQGTGITPVYWNTKNGLKITYSFLNSKGQEITSKYAIICRKENDGGDDDTYKWSDELREAINNTPYVFFISQGQGTQVIPGRANGWNTAISVADMGLINKDYEGTAKLAISAEWVSTDNPASYGTAGTNVYAVLNGDIICNYEVDLNYQRSESSFTINDLWNKESNIFTEIVKYCKMFRIMIDIDEVNKTINFVQAKTYFSDYTIEDWTDKLDLSRSFTVKPIVWEDKYVLFNYNDGKTKLEEEYSKNYGINYGEYRLITDYNFNTESKKLFDDFKAPILNTDNTLSWINLYDNHNIVYSFAAENFVYSKDKDNKFVDTVFGRYYFFDKKQPFSLEEDLQMRDAYISDDTDLQTSTKTYFYSQDVNQRYSANYTQLSVNKDNYLCIFNIPVESYTYNDEFTGGSTIYDLYWKNYINERYNIQNKLITCYLVLSPIDYIMFRFNKFIKIDNQLYMINKIYDYDITNTGSTKVDLITVQNINGYC